MSTNTELSLELEDTDNDEIYQDEPEVNLEEEIQKMLDSLDSIHANDDSNDNDTDNIPTVSSFGSSLLKENRDNGYVNHGDREKRIEEEDKEEDCKDSRKDKNPGAVRTKTTIGKDIPQGQGSEQAELIYGDVLYDPNPSVCMHNICQYVLSRPCPKLTSAVVYMRKVTLRNGDKPEYSKLHKFYKLAEANHKGNNKVTVWRFVMKYLVRTLIPEEKRVYGKGRKVTEAELAFVARTITAGILNAYYHHGGRSRTLANAYWLDDKTAASYKKATGRSIGKKIIRDGVLRGDFHKITAITNMLHDAGIITKNLRASKEHKQQSTMYIMGEKNLYKRQIV
jgi:hypothetical protein